MNIDLFIDQLRDNACVAYTSLKTDSLSVFKVISVFDQIDEEKEARAKQYLSFNRFQQADKMIKLW